MELPLSSDTVPKNKSVLFYWVYWTDTVMWSRGIINERQRILEALKRNRTITINLSWYNWSNPLVNKNSKLLHDKEQYKMQSSSCKPWKVDKHGIWVDALGFYSNIIKCFVFEIIFLLVVLNLRLKTSIKEIINLAFCSRLVLCFASWSRSEWHWTRLDTGIDFCKNRCPTQVLVKMIGYRTVKKLRL